MVLAPHHFRLHPLALSRRVDPYTAVISCTSYQWHIDEPNVELTESLSAEVQPQSVMY